MKRITAYLLLFFYGTSWAFSQNLPEKGVPLLENFTPSQYQNKGKIWDIQSAPNGIVYMAADKGLLEYDGKNWKSFKGSKGFTRSVLVINDSLIYTGSDLDFGVWNKNKFQGFDYRSLYPFQEEVLETSEEFWHVHQINNSILFVSSQNIYVYINQQLLKIAAPSGITGNFRVDDALYFTDKLNGVFVFEEFSLRKVFEFPEGIDLKIVGMYKNPKGLTIVTRDLGLYHYESGVLSRFENALSENLRTAKVFSFEKIGNTHVAFGTVLKGLYIADSDQKIVHHINRHKGLPSNTVLSLQYSRTGKLWLGMDYGVSSLDMRSSFNYFFDYRGDFGTAYTALLSGNVFYLGTNQGCYRTDWDGLNNNLEFIKLLIIPGTEGQVWTLEKINNTLFMGHDKGLFIVRDKAIERIGTQEGVWEIIPYKNYLLTGNYNGISVYRNEGNYWTFLKKMDLILGSCNQLIIERDNILWINIPNFGIIRAVLDNKINPEERLIFREEIFEGTDPYLSQEYGKIRVTTHNFSYTYDEDGRCFMRENHPENEPQSESLLAGMHKSVPLNPDYEFYPVHNGFALKYHRNNDSTDSLRPVLTLRKIEALRNNEVKLSCNGARVPYPFNNIRIECIVPDQNNVLYQYKLDDQNEWSPWVSDNSFMLSGLKYGDHLIVFRASVHGELTEQLTLDLQVLPPWYLKWYAVVVYSLLLVVLFLSILGWRNRSLNKQKMELLTREKNALRQQSEKHKQDILQIEQERLQSQYEELKQQMKNKTIELARKARDNEEKNRLILSLKENCEKAMKNPSLSKIKLGEMSRILDSYLNEEDKTFDIQMEELHQDFLKKMKEKFPGLSHNDLRLCVYLKIGLNSKEIADILNIQPSSSYISRSRLRKKLNLKTEEDLYDFLNRI